MQFCSDCGSIVRRGDSHCGDCGTPNPGYRPRPNQGGAISHVGGTPEEVTQRRSLTHKWIVAHWRQYLWPVLCVVALLLAVLLDWPYAYYVLLRLLVCAVSVYSAIDVYRRNPGFWVWAFAANAVLFNPVLPVRMEQSDWEIVNLGDALFFASWMVSSFFRDRKSRDASVSVADDTDRRKENSKSATQQNSDRPQEECVRRSYELLTFWLDSGTRLRVWLKLQDGITIRADRSVVAATPDGFHVQAEGAELRFVIAPTDAQTVSVRSASYRSSDMEDVRWTHCCPGKLA